MDIRKIAAGSAVAAIALGAVLPAAALNVKTDDTVTGSVSGATDSGTSGNVGIKTGVEGSANVSGAEEREGNENEINVAVGDVNGDGRADVSDTVSNDVLMITRADIDSNAVDSSSWNNSRAATEVKSSADLKAYVASQLKNDENLSAVESNSSDVAVTYKQHGRFLGFIPVTLKATAVVDQNGQVTVKYPWYAFLTATDRADLQAKLQASVDAMARASASGTAGNSTTTPNANAVANANANASFKLTTEMQARVVSELRRIMGEEFNASVSTNTNASATATN